jgi:hypothetical protein
MSIACKWNWHNTGHQVWYDNSTFETLESTYPLQFYDDFLGSAGGSVFDATMIWQVIDVSAGGAVTTAIAADSSNGLFVLALDATQAEDEDAVLYQNDNRNFDVDNGLIFETKVDVAVLPTLTAEAVFGMCGDHNLDNDTAAESCWFKLDGSGAVVVENDDATAGHTNDDVATGVTAVPGTYNIYRIDFTTLSDVKFFIDGARVASGTTFNMSTLTGATAILQPYFSLDKTNDLGAGTLNIDYVKILTNRS